MANYNFVKPSQIQDCINWCIDNQGKTMIIYSSREHSVMVKYDGFGYRIRTCKDSTYLDEPQCFNRIFADIWCALDCRLLLNGKYYPYGFTDGCVFFHERLERFYLYKDNSFYLVDVYSE